MHIRFPTEAANADSMQGDGPDADAGGKQPPPRTDDPGGGTGKPAPPSGDDVKPGKDINAPGFVRDKDAGKP